MIMLLGFLDLLAAATLLALRFEVGYPLAGIMVVYLFVKAAIFFRDLSSVIDFIVAIIFVLALFGTYNWITYLAIIWLVQKGIASYF